MTRNTLARSLAAALVVVLAATQAHAKLAVFVDGRVLKVRDAAMEGDRIRLVLPGGGQLLVPATRIDRVVEDEVSEPPSVSPPRTPACPTTWRDEPLPAGTPFAREIRAAARAAGIHPWLLGALVQAESGFDPRARSRAGAAGLTQLMPAAAADHGVEDVWDPEQNLLGGARHLRMLLDRFGDVVLALAAYNAGAATVERAGGVPRYRETRGFIRRVLEVFCPGAAHPPTR